MRSFGNFEPGSALGCACGLGELLPDVSLDSSSEAGAAQYDALASGAAVGGNWKQFQDAAAQGWFTNDKAGYRQYLGYNQRGLVDALYDARPEYAGYVNAATMANAVATKMHQGSSSSPLYDVPTGIRIGLASVQGMAQNHKWTAAQLAAAQQAFQDNFARLLPVFGYQGPAVGPINIPVLIENPFFKSLGRSVMVDKSTVTYDGPDHDAAVASRGGREFSAGGVTWRWGASAAPAAAPVKMAELVLNRAKSPGTGGNWAVIGWRVQDIDPAGNAASSGPWTRWDGVANHMSSSTTRSFFYEDAEQEVAAGARVGDTRPSRYYDWPRLQLMAQQNGPGTPPPSNLGIDILAAPPAGQTPTWTDIAAPLPPALPPASSPPATLPPGGSAQAPIAPGVPPLTTSTGALVPGSAGGGELVPVASPADALPALGKGVLLLAGVGLLMLMNRRSRR